MKTPLGLLAAAYASSDPADVRHAAALAIPAAERPALLDALRAQLAECLRLRLPATAGQTAAFIVTLSR